MCLHLTWDHVSILISYFSQQHSTTWSGPDLTKRSPAQEYSVGARCGGLHRAWHKTHAGNAWWIDLWGFDSIFFFSGLAHRPTSENLWHELVLSVSQNSTRPPLKLSNVERITNFQILVLFGCLLAISLVCSIGQTIWKYQYGDDAWYMDLNCKSPDSPCWISYSTYFPLTCSYQLISFVILSS